MKFDDMLLDFSQEIEVKAPIADVFEGLIDRLGKNNTRPDDVPMPMEIEQRPGGRWFRDLGNDTGHLWGHVQSIKPPELFEVTGPLFMSYPVSGQLIVRLTESEGTTIISLRHRAFGLVEPEHKEGVVKGWTHYLTRTKEFCEK